MTALPACILDPLRTEILDLVEVALPAPADTHPLGWHRPRNNDGVAFDHLITVLVFVPREREVPPVGDEKIATPACSATTMRRRRDQWARAGLMAQLHAAVLAAYERIVGLDLGHVCIDGCIRRGTLRGSVRWSQPR